MNKVTSFMAVVVLTVVSIFGSRPAETFRIVTAYIPEDDDTTEWEDTTAWKDNTDIVPSMPKTPYVTSKVIVGSIGTRG